MKLLQIIGLTAFLICTQLITDIHSMTEGHRMGTSDIPLPRNIDALLPASAIVGEGSFATDILKESQRKPIIVIRYNGYRCQHCAEQLLTFKRIAEKLKKQGIKVVAFSPDTQDESLKFLTDNSFDRSVFTLISDKDNTFGKRISAVIEKNNEEEQLHVAMVVHKGKVVFANYSEQPFMNIQLLLDRASNEVYHSDVHKFSEKTLNSEAEGYEIKTIAKYPDIINPTDLAFNTDKFNRDELWVITGTEQSGEGVTIIRNIDSKTQSMDKRRDYAAGHFMWRTMAIDFGTNGTFGTAQNGEPTTDFTVPLVEFMGVTLWAADTAIFARRNQGPFGQVQERLASHLDMLHQSPYTMGIAHEKDNVYWTNDNMYNDICRYDFANPHEIGGTDHRDGIIKRYSEIKLKKREHNLPSHLVLDKNTDWLYYIDGSSIYRLNTQSGTVKRTLQVQPPRDENLQEFVEMTGVKYEPFITTGLKKPVGMALYNNLFAISDRDDGNIYMYQIYENEKPKLLKTIITGAEGIAGIEFDRFGNIYFVDQISSELKKVEITDKTYFTIEKNFVATDSFVTVNVEFSNRLTEAVEAHFLISPETKLPEGWAVILGMSDLTLQPQETLLIALTIQTNRKQGVGRFVVECNAKSADANFKHYVEVIAISNNNRKIIVEDATRENYSIAGDIHQTSKKNYEVLTSEEFLKTYTNNKVLETVVWNVGTHGFLNDLHSSIIKNLQNKQIEVLLSGDDPVTLYQREGKGTDMLRVFGAGIGSVDQVTSGDDDGRRVWKTIPNLFITQNMSTVNAQLPILYHYIGKGIIPVPNLSLSSNDAKAFITDNESSTKIRAVQREYAGTRNVYMGFNLSTITDMNLRRQLLERTITWLEASVAGAQENENFNAENGISLIYNNTMLKLVLAKPLNVTKTVVYNLAGQNVKEMQGTSGDNLGEISIPLDNLNPGTYFVVLHSDDKVFVEKFSK